MTDFPFPSLGKITISESQKWHHQHCETSRLGVFKNGTMYNLPVTINIRLYHLYFKYQCLACFSVKK